MERMGVGLALLVALCWGSADIVATVAARRQGTFATTLLSLIVSSTVLLLFGWLALPQLLVGRGPSSAITGLGLVLLAGILTAVGYFSLYRGLELGPMAIVSPITAADGVIGAILTVLFLRNSLSFWQTGMMLVVVVGIVCASLDPTAVQRFVKAGGATSLFRGGIWWGLLAMLSFGVMLFSIGLLSATWGWYLPILSIRTVAALTMLTFALWRVSRLRSSGKGASSTLTKRSQLTSVGRSLAILVGVLETAGLLLYSLDTQLASTSLASVLSSSWGIIPLLAGIAFFRERPLPLQMFGIVLVVGGLLLLALKPT